MNKRTKHILQRLFVNDICWAIASPFIWVANRLSASRANYKAFSKQEALRAAAEQVFPDKKVKHGPFAGMDMQGALPTGSSYYAKLLGSYEKEVQPFVEDALQHSYSAVINIGCDEGYYAVGVALRVQGPAVFAFDSNPVAVEQCRRLATVNEVQGRMQFCGRFSVSDFARWPAGERNLFIVDCEGDEAGLFTHETAMQLQQATLLIELHLDADPLLVTRFKDIFGDSHHVTIADSVPDHLKALDEDYPELGKLNWDLRHFITEEREEFMQWVYLVPKVVSN